MSKKGGRVNMYETRIKPKLMSIWGWSKNGLNDKQIMKNLGITKTTFYKYKASKKEFEDALKNGREITDFIVENKLYQRATGMQLKKEQAYKVKKIMYENGKRKEEEKIEVVQLLEEIPPDVVAIIYWLKNRKQSDWSDRQKHEVDATINIPTIINDAPTN